MKYSSNRIAAESLRKWLKISHFFDLYRFLKVFKPPNSCK